MATKKKETPATVYHDVFKGPNVVIETDRIKVARAAIRAYDHPIRQALLKMMNAAEVPVTEMYKKLKIEQSVCSQHLKILRDASLVETRREGKLIYYRLSESGLKDLKKVAAIY
jgi:DNA-binding transcriptional ArsR family regulator